MNRPTAQLLYQKNEINKIGSKFHDKVKLKLVYIYDKLISIQTGLT